MLAVRDDGELGMLLSCRMAKGTKPKEVGFRGSLKKVAIKSPFRKISFCCCSFLRPEAEFQRGPLTDTVLYSKDFQEQKSKDYELKITP